jgi:hypothetical protein
MLFNLVVDDFLWFWSSSIENSFFGKKMGNEYNVRELKKYHNLLSLFILMNLRRNIQVWNKKLQKWSTKRNKRTSFNFMIIDVFKLFNEPNWDCLDFNYERCSKFNRVQAENFQLQFCNFNFTSQPKKSIFIQFSGVLTIYTRGWSTIERKSEVKLIKNHNFHRDTLCLIFGWIDKHFFMDFSTLLCLKVASEKKIALSREKCASPQGHLLKS